MCLGLGYAAVLINSFVGFYYNVIIAYCLYYFVFSLRAKLLWADCPANSVDCYKRSNFSDSFDCKLEKQNFMEANKCNILKFVFIKFISFNYNLNIVTRVRMPSEIYF